MMKRNDGFTMVELLITIVAAAVVTIAAASLILLGTRIQHASTADASEQQTVRIVMNLLEKMAGSGEIKRVENSNEGWVLKGVGEQVLFTYNKTAQTLCSGEASGPVLLERLADAAIELASNGLLRISFKTERGGSYSTAILCRMNITPPATELPVTGSIEGERGIFLTKLIAEYQNGPNTGKITGTDQYYSQWYSQKKMNIDWPANTPWCACYLSWAAVNARIIDSGSDYCFANVDTGIEVFRANGAWKEVGDTPTPGDYIFFDWSGGEDPSHVGVVLNVITDGETGKTTIYTIEGNSGGVIAVRQYNKASEVIIGYGSLPFADETPVGGT